MAIGIDEVGRGCWAGPLLVIALRQVRELPGGVADSKLLSKKRREHLFGDIIHASEIGEGWVSPADIDRVGLTNAMRLAVRRALHALDAIYDEEVILDGNINYCPTRFTNSRALINADADHPIVSAASIIAKVLRDNYMVGIAGQFPLYGFEKHVGYGTKLHYEMIKLNGICKIHRQSYKPLKAFLDV